MPLYDYLCENCGETFEIRLSFQEKEASGNPVCPICGQDKTQQRLTVGMFIQKGNNAGRNTPSFGCGPGAGAGCCG